MAKFGPGDVIAQRYELVSRLGKGAFGVVHEAFDRTLRQRVAVKSLTRADGKSLRRFKREFRSVADLMHPNLVQLHELLEDGDATHLVMEYVPGEELRGWVGTSEVSSGLNIATTWDGADPSETRVVVPETTAPLVVDVERVRDAVRQVVEAVAALHAAGWIHRDLKPSNIRVRPDGVVKVLDLGLVTRDRERAGDAVEMGGTPGYMAPEQIGGEHVGPAADWFSLGAVLYHLLTGRPPYAGTLPEIYRDSRYHNAVPISTIVPDAPEDLAKLCMDLLHPDPEQRPDVATIRAILAGETPPPRVSSVEASVFVGRREELLRIREAFDTVRGGQPAVVRLRALSGMGKTTLLEHGLDEIRKAEPTAVVLTGACYAGDRLAYAGIDSVIDDLVGALSGWQPKELGEVLPRDFDELCRLFPALEELPYKSSRKAGKLRSAEGASAASGFRVRAYAAARELFENLATRRPLVLAVDDVQWMDDDGAAVLRELVRKPMAPMMVLLAWRDDELSESPPLQSLLKAASANGARSEDLLLQALSEADALEAAEQWLDDEDAERKLAIVRDSAGSPFLLQALAAHGGQEGGDLGELLDSRIAAMSPVARCVLEVVAVAPWPLPMEAVATALHELGQPTSDLAEAVQALRAHRLVRSNPRQETVTQYHATIGTLLGKRLDADRRRELHGALAAGMLSTQRSDPERVATHLLESGDSNGAVRHILTAAEQASKQLAHRHAAHLYGRVLDLANHPDASVDVPAVSAARADALAAAGQCKDAGALYLQLAETAFGEQRHRFRMRAMQELYRSADHQRARLVAHSILKSYGVVPRGGVLGQMQLGFQVMRLLWRGLKWHSPESLDPARVRRVADLITLAVSMAGIDLYDYLYVALVAAREALDLGDGELVALGLATASPVFSSAPPNKLTLAVVDAAERECNRLGTDACLDLWSYAGFYRYLFGGDYQRCFDHAEAQEARWAKEGRLPPMESSFVRWGYTGTKAYAFGLNELRAGVSEAMVAGAQTGDLALLGGLRCSKADVWLAEDKPQNALADLDEARAMWGDERPLIAHTLELHARARVLLYQGRVDDAIAYLDARIAFLRPGYFLTVPFYGQIIRSAQITAYLAKASQATGAERRRWLSRARWSIRILQWLPNKWARSAADVFWGLLEAEAGRYEQARALLAKAETQSPHPDFAILAGAWYLLGGVDPHAEAVRRRQRVAELLKQGGVEDVDAFVRSWVSLPTR